MTLEVLTAWLLATMTATVPPGREQVIAEARESIVQGRARYAEIAAAVAEVALDPAEAPAFGGRDGRERTAMLLLAVALHESAWRRDVDLGVGRWARGDRGKSACLVQINVGRGKTAEGWTMTDLLADRRKCFRAGLRMIRASMTACRAQPLEERLAVYASGSCDRGLEASRRRMRSAWRLWARVPRPAAGQARVAGAGSASTRGTEAAP